MGRPYYRMTPRPEPTGQQFPQLHAITGRVIEAPTATLSRWKYEMEVALTTQGL